MINLITISLRFTVLILSAFYAFSKLSQAKLKPIDLLFIPTAAAFSVALYYISRFVGILTPTFILLVIILLAFVRFKIHFYETVSLSIIAYGVAILVMVFCAIIAAIVFIPSYVLLEESLQNLIEQILLSVLHVIFTFVIFKIKRLKSGLLNSTRQGISYERMAFAGSVCIFGFTLSYLSQSRNVLVELIFVFISFYCLTLVILWRGHISEKYRNDIYRRNIKILEDKISEEKTDKTRLASQNEKLAKIIHRDNKLLPAMEIAVKKVCEKYPTDGQTGALLENLSTLYGERVDAVENLENEAHTLAQTNIVSLDAVLGYLYGKAKECGATFELEVDNDAVDEITKKSEDDIDLVTLICDLGENAVIAVRKASGGKVKIIFGKTDEYPFFKIYDNGAPFDEHVIARMGLNKITTHKDEGGSGIGFINTFELLRKNDASLVIDELAVGEDFTKSIAVLFDGKYAHRVYSARANLKKLCSYRADLQISEKPENTKN